MPSGNIFLLETAAFAGIDAAAYARRFEEEILRVWATRRPR